jgi:amino acid transporter
MMATETRVDRPTQKSSLLRTVKAVAWSFIGLRKGSEFAEDVKQLNPLHLVAVGIAGAVVLVLALVAVVHWVV